MNLSILIGPLAIFSIRVASAQSTGATFGDVIKLGSTLGDPGYSQSGVIVNWNGLVPN